MEYTQDIPDQLFDTRTPEDEEQALRELAGRAKAKHLIAGSMFVGRFSDGVRITLPLQLTVGQFRRVGGLSEADGIDQFTQIVQLLGNETEAAKLDHEPFTEVAQLLGSAYPDALQKVIQLSMGESKAS
ncbi:hypothetical protein EMO89_01685 [Bifidobacterium tissieri]|uniref:Uncharacterized protein n=1 Tax=Bifidobacterium tissieri TaxID=1630162 RepID=A0A5M9ZX84_9BIFI|nr:hypothetical protein [Bifidobacterium tissieri]KAA8831472.1 hypothetical protein EMO89_01685 [Bifidobacterium tissieri]